MIRNVLLGLLIAGFSFAYPQEGLANGTLQVTGNACEVDPKFKTSPPESLLVGRITIFDELDNVLHTAENVPLARSGKSFDNCLVDFDIAFDDTLLAALLSEPLAVLVETCYEERGASQHPAETCAFGDNAEVIVDEPIDTLLDDVVAFVLASYEANCPAGSALKSVDLDGTPGFVCTDEFALDTELAAEIAARQSADATLQANINAEAAARQSADATLQANINAEAAARISADSNLQSQISSNDSDIALLRSANRNCPTGEFLARIDLGGTPILVCRPETIQTLSVVPVSDTNSCGCTPRATGTVACCRLSSGVGGGEDPIGCIVVGGSGVSFSGSNCGTTTANLVGSGSCTTSAPTATCPSGTVRTGCSPGAASGSASCTGSSATLSCSGLVNFSISCDCSPNLLGCGVQCTDTDSGATQTRIGPAATAQCLSISS